MGLVAFVWLLLPATGCLESPVTACADGTVCPAGKVCLAAEAGYRCVSPGLAEACAGRSDGETCSLSDGDFGNVYATSTTTVRLLPASDEHIVDGTGTVMTIYEGGHQLTGIAVVDDKTLWLTDSPSGQLIEVSRGTL